MPPILKTKRMKLRPPNEGDYESIYRLGSSVAVMTYINGGIPQTRSEAKADLQKRLRTAHLPLGYWIAETKEDSDFIGWMCLKQLDESPYIEIGYRFLEEYWGKGLATEGSWAILEYGFENLKLETIHAIARETNRASTRVMEKIGMEKQGYETFYGIKCVVYLINRTTYLKSRG